MTQITCYTIDGDLLTYEIPDLRPDSDRPAEAWFLAIESGRAPAGSKVARITEGWILEWATAHQVAL